ncbi:phage holin family protein [Mycolicibacterium vaccae]|uniref:phage holin family protein n=1 Tax=Mycolicibacterium vaccae TaxID=1810 RepID=UPI003D0251A2
MLIVALVLAVIGLAALVTAVVTSNELIAWVCIAASAVGVILLIVDAVRDRSKRDAAPAATDTDADTDEDQSRVEDYPDEAPIAEDYEDEPSTGEYRDEQSDAPASESDVTEDEKHKS